MALLATILILIVWGIAGLVEKLTPEEPPIEDLNAFMEELIKTTDIKAMKRWIKSRRKK